MSDLPPPPGSPPPPPPPPPGGSLPPPPSFTSPAPPGYVPYGEHRGLQAPFAGFWIRFLAAFIDGLIVGVPMAMLGNLLGAFDSTSTDAFGNETDSSSFQLFAIGWTPGASTWFNLVNTLVGLAYFAALEGGPTGQTIGKRVCGIRVVDAGTGQPGIGVGRGIGRYFARWLSAIALLLGYFWMLWDSKKQTWHDKLVSTVVVKG